MRYCFHCKHLNLGKPKYCPYCRYTFNIKLCPRGHINLPDNLICGECGSEDLSQPALVPGWIRNIKSGLFVLMIIIIINGAKLFMQFIALLFLIGLMFFGLMNFINVWTPEPLNKIFNILRKVFFENKHKGGNGGKNM